jgi:hypothetical protein
MIEVHLVRLEPPAAVRAGDTSQVPGEFDHPGLPDPDPLQFQVSISTVVLDVVRSLAWTSRHDSF